MQRFEMVGIGCQRLAAAKLRLEMAAGLHVADAGLVERGRTRNLIGCLRGSLRRSLGGVVGPAFGAVHGRISKEVFTS
jgi:hypothetical protein